MAEQSTRGWSSRRTPIHGLHDRFAPRAAGEAGGPTADLEEEGEVAGEDTWDTPENDVQPYPPDLVFIVGPEGTVLFVNRELPGVPQGEVLGASIYRYIYPEQHDLVRSCLERVFGTGEAGGYECRGLRPHDAKSWYQCRVAPNHREGRVVSATIIARDITSLKRIEARLRQQNEQLRQELQKQSGEVAELKRAASERLAREGERSRGLEQFRELMDQAGEAIFISDPVTGRILDVNNTACRWLGRSREELIALTASDLEVEFPIQSPVSTAEHVVDTRDTQRPRTFDHGLHRRRDGTIFPVEVAIAHRWVGDNEYVLAVAREINSRKRTEAALREAEDHYRTLFTLAHDAIYLSARDGTVAEANDAAVALFGYPRETLIGAPAKQLYRRSEDIRRFQRSISEQGAVRDMVVELVRRDGSTFSATLSATLRRSGDGTLLGYQCVLRPTEEGAQPAEGDRVATTVVPPAPPVDRPEHDEPASSVTPAAAEVAADVLLMDPNPTTRQEARAVLERAGIGVVEAVNDVECHRAVQTLESGVGAILVARPLLEAGWECYQELRKRRPGARLLVLADEGEAETDLTRHSGVQSVPRHPLALVQRIREVLGLES